MIQKFQKAYPHCTKMVNVREAGLKGGCLGCLRCAATGKCIYKDIEKRFDANYCHLRADNLYTQGKCHFNSLIEITLNVGMILYYIIVLQPIINII